ncbi:hypothetical protein IFM89_009320 [Coptis chinensis]|uniref:Nodal modulator 1 n=1 Tax=Coptis chinensis TaxID=261450 RepID=A0A835IQH7_9MAGN|nr:hypothetical protein IFM89_009320 [Coptis chinensis]
MGTLIHILLYLTILISTSSFSASADSIQGCGGFVEASSSLIKARKSSDAKLDYSHITVELRTVDGLVKDSTQCAPNGYYFIPVYDKGSFVIKVKGPEGWSWDPDKVPVVIDHNGCNVNEDINFRFTGFTVSGRVVGAVGGESCSVKDGGPPGVKVELLSTTNDIVSSAVTNSGGSYLFTNIIPGSYNLRASHSNLEVESRGSSEVEVGFGNTKVDDIFFVPGYDIQGFVVAQLLPYYKGENKVFDVSPPSVSVSVEHHHVTVPQKFQGINPPMASQPKRSIERTVERGEKEFTLS